MLRLRIVKESDNVHAQLRLDWSIRRGAIRRSVYPERSEQFRLPAICKLAGRAESDRRCLAGRESLRAAGRRSEGDRHQRTVRAHACQHARLRRSTRSARRQGRVGVDRSAASRARQVRSTASAARRGALSFVRFIARIVRATGADDHDRDAGADRNRHRRHGARGEDLDRRAGSVRRAGLKDK